jgi:leucyl/phenylalanyl-tRNA--protein transferase
MPVFRLNDELIFPDPNWATAEGLLAVGGDLTPERLILAYQLGLFPWYGEDEPILWWSPNPRCVLIPRDVYVSSGLFPPAQTFGSARVRKPG